MATTGDVLESKDLQTMISDRNETAEMMVKRVWPRVDSWKVQWSKKLTSMRFKVRWHNVQVGCQGQCGCQGAEKTLGHNLPEMSESGFNEQVAKQHMNTQNIARGMG